jgi:hypothetical protein
VLKKNGEDHLDQSCKKRSVTTSQGGAEYPANHNKWKANWTGYILRRNCFIIRVTEGNVQERIQVIARRRRRRKQLLDDLNATER